MDLLGSAVLDGLALRMRHLSARAGVIAENVANADTPGYVARDVAAPDFAARARTHALAANHERHIRAASLSSSALRTVAAPDGEASLTGNEVSLETQMMKLSETRMDYQLATSLYRKGLDMMRLAARGGR